MNIEHIPGELLNHQTLVMLVGDDKATIEKFQKDFISQARQSLQKISGLYNAKHLPEIKEEAHFLKTSAKAIGAEKAAELLQQLEHAGLSNDAVRAKLLIMTLSIVIKQLNKEIYDN